MGIAIGTLSRRTGVKVPTIRYYEAAGLIAEPGRTEGGQRRYAAADVARLSFIRHARDLGFGLEAIRELLALSGRPDSACAEVDALARRHRDAVDRRIAQLTALRGELDRMVEECGHGRVGECHVLGTLGDHALCATEHRSAPVLPVA